MKIFNYIVSAAFGTLALTSCTDLSEKLYDQVASENYYNTKNDVVRATFRPFEHAYWSIESRHVLNELTADQLITPTRDGWWDDGGKWRRYHYHEYNVEDGGDCQTEWNGCFQGIMQSCKVREDLGTLSFEKFGFSQSEFNNLTAQCRVLRAWFYLRLLDGFRNVPLVTTTTGASMKQVEPKVIYDFIESELKTAKEELKDYKPTTKYRVTSEVASILLSRLYLYEEKWDECIEASNEAISNGPQLSNFNSFNGTDHNVWSVDESSEVVWNYSGRLYGSSYIDGQVLSADAIPYSLDSHILALYDQTNDIRYKKYIQNYGSYAFVMKTSFNSLYDGEHGVRMAEVYLNRAEAYARKALAGNGSAMAQALADINKLRRSRYVNGTYTDITDITSDKLLQLVLDERQREFVWEDGFRWMDIKRNHLSVTHNFIDDTGNTHTYRLKADDPLYALPIPAAAVSRNPNLQQNPR